MKNRVILPILTLIFLVSIAYAGINDRFADLELVDVTSTASEINKLSGIGSGDVVTTANTKTLTNKTLTSPTINTQVASGGTFNIPTLTTPIIVSLYQDSGRTKLMTMPNTASDTLVSLNATQTLTNKTLTTQVSSGGTFTNPTLNFFAAAHEYTTNADWTLSASEGSALLLIVTSGSTGVNIVAPNTTGRMYALRNDTSQTVTLKKSGGTGISIATGKTAILFHSGSDYVRITADATH